MLHARTKESDAIRKLHDEDKLLKQFYLVQLEKTVDNGEDKGHTSSVVRLDNFP